MRQDRGAGNHAAPENSRPTGLPVGLQRIDGFSGRTGAFGT